MGDEDRVPLIETVNLKKYFEAHGLSYFGKQTVRAVDGVNLKIQKGETFGLVGESGCGKSTLGRTILQMYEATDGQVLYQGTDIVRLRKKELAAYRRKMQIIFQDPYASLNPFMTVEELVGEPLAISRKERRNRVSQLLEAVGLGAEDLDKFSYEFSGGQRQRIGIARALSVNPEFILCDEPISALDVSIQAQVVNMLQDLQESRGLTYLFIAHDLAVVRHISHHIGVMYLGRIVETAGSEELYCHPAHPYTKILLASVPVPDPKAASRMLELDVRGELPDATDSLGGCTFAPRCPYADENCRLRRPELQKVAADHWIACWKS